MRQLNQFIALFLIPSMILEPVSASRGAFFSDQGGSGYRGFQVTFISPFQTEAVPPQAEFVHLPIAGNHPPAYWQSVKKYLSIEFQSVPAMYNNEEITTILTGKLAAVSRAYRANDTDAASRTRDEFLEAVRVDIPPPQWTLFERTMMLFLVEVLDLIGTTTLTPVQSMKEQTFIELAEKLVRTSPKKRKERDLAEDEFVKIHAKVLNTDYVNEILRGDAEFDPKNSQCLERLWLEQEAKAGAEQALRNGFRAVLQGSLAGLHAGLQTFNHLADHNSMRVVLLLDWMKPHAQKRHGQFDEAATLSNGIPAMPGPRSPVDEALDQIPNEAARRNEELRAFIQHWFEKTGAGELEIVDASDEPRLRLEARVAGEIHRGNDGNDYAWSHPGDTARSVERTFIATNHPEDKGFFNNHRLTAEVKPRLEAKIAGSYRGKKMYVVASVMADGRVGVQLTDSRYGVLNMITMNTTGKAAWDLLANKRDFPKVIHSTGDLNKIRRARPGHPEDPDDRDFGLFPEENLVMLYGSEYGGNLIGLKKFLELRWAQWVAYQEAQAGTPAAEQWMPMHMAVVGYKEVGGGTRYFGYVAPSQTGKTTVSTQELLEDWKKHYEGIELVADDIVWVKIDENGDAWAKNPETGSFGVLYGVGKNENPGALNAFTPVRGHMKPSLVTNPAFNYVLNRGFWEDPGASKPSLRGNGRHWKNWARLYFIDLAWQQIFQSYPKFVQRLMSHRGTLWALRYLTGEWGFYIHAIQARADKMDWAHKNSRFTTPLVNFPSYQSIEGGEAKAVRLEFILGVARDRDTEPALRVVAKPGDKNGVLTAVHAFFTLRAEGTAAADGKSGKPDWDPFALNPFMAIREDKFLQYNIDFWSRWKNGYWARYNPFRKDDAGNPMLPGPKANFTFVDYMFRFVNGEVHGQETPVGITPAPGEMRLDGINTTQEKIQEAVSVNPERWRYRNQEARRFLERIPYVPSGIWDAQEALEKSVGSDVNHEPSQIWVSRLVRAATGMARDTRWKLKIDEAVGLICPRGPQGDPAPMATLAPNGEIQMNEKVIDAYALLIWASTREMLTNLDFDRLNRRLTWEPDYKKIRLVLVEDTYFHELIEFYLRRHDPDATVAALTPFLQRHHLTLHEGFHAIAQWLEDDGRDNELGGWFLDMDPAQRSIGAELFNALPSNHPVVQAYTLRSKPPAGQWTNRRRQLDFLERQAYSYRKRSLNFWLTPLLFLPWIARAIWTMTRSSNSRVKEWGLQTMKTYQQAIDTNFSIPLREIAQGREATAEEVRMLERAMLADPVQRAFLQVNGKDVSEVVRERLRVLQLCWPGFSDYWRNDFGTRGDQSFEIPVDSLWRVYIPLAQWFVHETRNKPVPEGYPHQFFEMLVYGSQGRGKTIISRALTPIVNVLFDRQKEGQVTYLSIDDEYKDAEQRKSEGLREMGYDPGVPGVSNRGPADTHRMDYIHNRIELMRRSKKGSLITIDMLNKRTETYSDADQRKLEDEIIGLFWDGWFNGCDTEFDINQIPQGTFARTTAEALLRDYKPLFDQADAVFAFDRPPFEEIVRNRQRQEELQEQQQGSRQMTDAGVERFVGYFEHDSWQEGVNSPEPPMKNVTFKATIFPNRHFAFIEHGGRFKRNEYSGLSDFYDLIWLPVRALVQTLVHLIGWFILFPNLINDLLKREERKNSTSLFRHSHDLSSAG